MSSIFVCVFWSLVIRVHDRWLSVLKRYGRLIVPTNSLRRCVISLLIQYSLVISLLILPFSNTAIVRAEQRPSFSGEPAARDFLIPAIRKTSVKSGNSQQETRRPTIIPPLPGKGFGGNGPDGTFNVDPPSRRQGPPAGVRDTSDVLNETRTRPSIPDPIPSTRRYCWPGDPACRKTPSTTKPLTPTPKPTPPPRPQRASVLQPELLVARNGGYIEKLLSSAMPYLSHLWNSEDLHRENRTFVSSSKNLSAFVSPVTRAESVSTSFIWADCSNVQGYADNAQATVYIYVDGSSVAHKRNRN